MFGTPEYAAALAATIQQASERARNTGHGHVRPRPDGFKSRCGGPVFCAECSREASSVTAEPIDHDPGVVVTRVEFAPGHEDARMTSEQVAALMRKVRLAPKLLEALKEWVEPWGNAAFLPESKISRHRALIAEADGRSPQEPA